MLLMKMELIKEVKSLKWNECILCYKTDNYLFLNLGLYYDEPRKYKDANDNFII